MSNPADLSVDVFLDRRHSAELVLAPRCGTARRSDSDRIEMASAATISLRLLGHRGGPIG